MLVGRTQQVQQKAVLCRCEVAKAGGKPDVVECERMLMWFGRARSDHARLGDREIPPTISLQRTALCARKIGAFLAGSGTRAQSRSIGAPPLNSAVRLAPFRSDNDVLYRLLLTLAPEANVSWKQQEAASCGCGLANARGKHDVVECVPVQR